MYVHIKGEIDMPKKKTEWKVCKCNDCKGMGGRILCTATKSKMSKGSLVCNINDLTLDQAEQRRKVTSVLWHRYLNSRYEPKPKGQPATYDGRDIIVQS